MDRTELQKLPSSEFLDLLKNAGIFDSDLVIERFELAACSRPDAIALTCLSEDDDDRFVHRITYGRLNRMAARLGRDLSSGGVGPESTVGVAIEHDFSPVVGMLGVMKAAASFLPLDGSLPEARIQRMAAECSLATILVSEKNKARYRSCGVDLMVIDDYVQPEVAGDFRKGALPENAAYTIYTSGSTGEPKGVVVTQAALANHNRCYAQTIGIAPEDVFLQFASMAFDVAYEEIFPSLCRGANLVLRNSQMGEDIQAFLRNCRDQQVTIIDIPTAYWHLLTSMLAGGGLHLPESFRCVAIGGEEASTAKVKYWRDNYRGKLRLVNTYGPTETTIITTMCDLLGGEREKEDHVPLGSCLEGESVTLYGSKGRCKPGEIGEIYISGAGVARGYVNAPGLTAERFVPDELGNGERAYQTGDMAVLTGSGDLLFKGRRDYQVKVSGHRVQPEEVENALLSHPSIASCAVLLKDDRLGGKHLVAYCVLKHTQTSLPFEMDPISVTSLRDFLRERIPGYMVPGEFSFMERFILNSSGKIDRSKLPELGRLDRARRRLPAYQKPRPGVETKLARIWCDVLDLEFEELSAEDPFEYLGGNSLYSIQVRYKADQAGLLFKASDLHLKQSIRGLAQCTHATGGRLSRARHVLVDYVNYARGIGGIMLREAVRPVTRLGGRRERQNLRLMEKFYSELHDHEDIIYIFFTPLLLHWLAATLSFVPSACNVVLIGSGLSDEEVSWVQARIKRPFLHLPKEIAPSLCLDVLFAVNKKNFGWLDVDCFIMNPSLFDEMRVMPASTAINCLWTHAACGPTKRPFHVLESYFVFFNVAVIKRLRETGLLPRPSAASANLRQIEALKKLIPAREEMSKRLDTLGGRAFIHRMLTFEFAPLALYQLVANACGFRLNRVRFFTEIDSFNLHNYYSDEGIHVFPSIRKYDSLGWLGIDQNLRLATDYLLMKSMMDILPLSYGERKRFLEERFADFELSIAPARLELYKYLADRGVTEKTFARKEFQWLSAGISRPRDPDPEHAASASRPDMTTSAEEIGFFTAGRN